MTCGSHIIHYPLDDYIVCIVCIVCESYLVIYLIWILIFEQCVVRLDLRKELSKTYILHILKRDWTMCSLFINKSRLSSTILGILVPNKRIKIHALSITITKSRDV